jgi:hypothetical protein
MLYSPPSFDSSWGDQGPFRYLLDLYVSNLDAHTVGVRPFSEPLSTGTTSVCLSIDRDQGSGVPVRTSERTGQTTTPSVRCARYDPW